MKRIVKRGVAGLVFLSGAALTALVFRPRPISVETARAERGPMEVTIDEDGQTRAHDRFTLASPVTGILSRTELHDGDRVRRGDAIATIRPLPIDSREEAEVRARVASAEAHSREAAQLVARALAAHQQAARDAARARQLFSTSDIPRQRLEDAQSAETVAAYELEAARQRAEAAGADVKRAEAGLLSLLQAQRGGPQARETVVRAPEDCRILRILEKSERAVTAGTPIAVLSNPGHLEVVADLLSTEAVKVPIGAPVRVENWGGEKPLCARVRTVEPYGFTKVSALGIEEQRVNVVADFVDPPGRLGDGFRVDVRIVVWESPKVLKVPASALFRSGNEWRVFVVEAGVVRSTAVQTGHRNALEVEITGGLSADTEIVLHPSNDLRDGARVLRSQGKP